MPRLTAKGKALVTSLLVLVVAGGSGLFLHRQAHRFPGDVATHWGIDGAPDQWQSFSSAVVTAVVLMAATPLFLVALGLALKAMNAMAGFAVGMSGFLSVLTVGSIWIQRDGNTAEPRVGPLLLVALLAGVVVGVLVGTVLWKLGEPDKRAAGPAPTPAFPLGGEAAQWEGRTRVARGVVIFGMVLTVVFVALAVLMGSQDPWAGVFMLLVTLVIPLSFAIGFAGIRISPWGVRATALGIIPLVKVPLHEITGAGTREVHALGDFGGWGPRASLDGSAQGLVMASGEALVVQRGELKDVVIVCNDAATAARTVASLIQGSSAD